MLEKPGMFRGEAARWGDSSTVIRAYSGLCDHRLAVSMPEAEVVASEADILFDCFESDRRGRVEQLCIFCSCC